MSAKHPKKPAKPTATTPASPTPAPAAPATTFSSAAATASPEGFTPWIDSTDPRKRTWGKLILAAVWIYVAALWLLALDQTFNWGILGPQVPPVP